VAKQRVLVADQAFVIRYGFQQLLKQLLDDVEFVGAPSVREACDLAKSGGPFDIVIIDPAQSVRPWVETIDRLCTFQPDATLVIFSESALRPDILKAVELGAAGYIPKSAALEEISRALGIMADHGIYLPRGFMEGPAVPVSRRDAPVTSGADAVVPAIENLTRRQKQVLRRLARGHTNAEIAKELGASEHTIRVHVSAVLKSLDVSSRTKAALIASQHFDAVDWDSKRRGPRSISRGDDTKELSAAGEG
jgi:DNA-binding NarL/FixJ family response regulator